MRKTCADPQCGQTFDVTEDDLNFYDKIAPVFGGKKFVIPPAELCPDTRHQHRMAFRNERKLYKRSCDLCKKPLIALYDVGAPFPVYCYECWWGDGWDAFSFGHDYDAGRPFFEQFQELMQTVPRLGIVTGHNENCEYCNYVNYSKSSYLCFGCHNVEECFHCWRAHWSQGCVDCLQLDKGQYCYEIIDCDDCYGLLFSQDCTGCRDSAFLQDCKGCSDCLFCTGLRGGEFYIFNEKTTKEEVAKKRAELKLDTASGTESARKLFASFLKDKPHRASFILNSENVVGDHVIDSRNCHECYHVKNAEDCRYLESCENIKDSMDSTFSGWPAELVFETMSAGVNCYRMSFCTASWSCSDLLYCDSCHHSENLFGCVGLRQKNKHCILNKQYSATDYEKLCARIIDDMTRGGEWGKFFPPHLSPHAYNETAANEFYPLTKEKAEKHGFQWKKEEDIPHAVKKSVEADRLPEKIDDIPDEILEWAIMCEKTDRAFRLTRPELEFYRRMHLPVPRKHPDQRHYERMARRNPRKLWQRACDTCKKPVASTFAPDRPEIVYCESCYLAAVY